MLPSWCRDTVTVTRPASRVQRGTTVADWANAQTHTVSGCSVQPSSTDMSLDGRTATSLSGSVFAPLGSDIRAGDRIAFGGHTYLVDGEPQERRSPTGRTSHLLVRIVEWRG